MRKLNSKPEAVASLAGHGVGIVIALVAGTSADRLYSREVAVVGPISPAGRHGLDVLFGFGTVACCLAGLAYATFGAYKAARFLKSGRAN